LGFSCFLLIFFGRTHPSVCDTLSHPPLYFGSEEEKANAVSLGSESKLSPKNATLSLQTANEKHDFPDFLKK